MSLLNSVCANVHFAKKKSNLMQLGANIADPA
jgi:hypothetical protein